MPPVRLLLLLPLLPLLPLPLMLPSLRRQFQVAPAGEAGGASSLRQGRAREVALGGQLRAVLKVEAGDGTVVALGHGLVRDMALGRQLRDVLERKAGEGTAIALQQGRGRDVLVGRQLRVVREVATRGLQAQDGVRQRAALVDGHSVGKPSPEPMSMPVVRPEA